MLKTLLRVRLRQSLNGLTGRSRKKVSGGKVILFAALMLYAAGAVAFMFVGMFSLMAEPYYTMGFAWLYFSITALTDFALMFLLGIFAAKAQLYEARDNELLLAMPIPPRTILASRMLSILLDNYVAGLLVAVPAGVVWLVKCPADPSMIACFVILFLLLPFLAVALADIVGFAVARLTAKVRNKTLMSTILTLAFLAAYFYFYSKIGTYVKTISQNGATVAASLGGFAPLVWAGKACADGDWLSLAKLVMLIAVVFAPVYVVLSVTFRRIATGSSGASKRKYIRKEMKQGSVRAALLKKELRRLASSTNYLINGALGAVFLLVLPIVLIFQKNALLTPLSMMGVSAGQVAAGAAGAICLILGTGSIAAPSVSLEGKSLWIPLSMPVRGRDVLTAKALCQIVIMLPAGLFAAAVTAAVLAPDVGSGILMVLVSGAYALFSALIGLVEGIKHPNFDWVSEVQVVKQSMAVLLTMLICWGAALAAGAGMVFLANDISPAASLAILTVLLAAADWCLYRWVCRNSGAIMARIA
jgi:ABC-2 type transport system permease protein